MKKLHIFALIFIASMYTSCASNIVVLKPSCDEMNWVERGRQDGMQGQPSNNWTMAAKECSDMSQKNIDRYMDGWNNGLSLFCTEDHGFLMAKSGQTYRKTCPEKYEQAFLRGYQRGVQVFIIERETTQIIAQIEGMEEKLRNEETTEIDKIQIRKHMSELTQRKRDNLKALERFNNSISRF